MYGPIKGELLQFKTRDGLILEGFLSKPKNGRLCIIYVHGWGGNFYRTLGMKIFESISKEGIGMFSINTRGHDGAARIKVIGRKNRSIEGGSELERFEGAALDIEGAIKQLRQLGFKKFVLCGHSTGCQKIVYYQLKKRDKSVLGLILIAPGDDYNIWKRIILRRSFDKKVRLAKRFVAERKGNQYDFIKKASPRRFLSVADLKNIEARLFNYDGELKEFSKVKSPILVLFGSKEEHALKPVTQYMKILEEKSNSDMFESFIVKGATHNFYDHENEVTYRILKFISRLHEIN